MCSRSRCPTPGPTGLTSASTFIVQLCCKSASSASFSLRVVWAVQGPQHPPESQGAHCRVWEKHGRVLARRC